MSILAIAMTLLAAVLAAAGVGFWFWRRRRKTPEERERARRLAVNALGRIVDGTLLEMVGSRSGSQGHTLISYRYSAAGVEYTAAQDLSGLEHLVRLEDCWPGRAAGVKYDPHNPYDSIIICEYWSGLDRNFKSDPPLPAKGHGQDRA